jgi:osmotically-inducible protein OsmY
MSDLRTSVRSILNSENRIGAFELTDVRFADDGALVVEGEVASVKAKKLALERIGAMPDVDLIVDRLHVRPAEAMSDAGIRAHLRDAYLQEPSFAGLSITQETGTALTTPPEASGNLDYSVTDGIVTLNGSVPGLASKRLAGLLAWWVPGSRDVINGISVAGEEVDSPQAVEEAVRIALEKDPFVDAGQVRVGARHQVVRLTGLVATQAQKDMAENDAWATFGVDDVINEIAVGP